MKREAGVTLLELLVAITLVSLLSAGMLFSMRMGVNSMNAINRRVAVNRRAMGAQRILEQQMGAFLPVYARCQGMGPEMGAERMFFFQGEPQVMQFVSGYSLTEAQRGLPRIVQLFVAPTEDGKGVRLLENEHPYNGPYGVGLFCAPPAADPLTGIAAGRFRQPEEQPGSFVVADRLAGVRFVYLDTHPENPLLDIWVPRWIEQNRMPRALRIELQPLEHDPSRVQPVSITLALHVTRDMKDGVQRR